MTASERELRELVTQLYEIGEALQTTNVIRARQIHKLWSDMERVLARAGQEPPPEVAGHTGTCGQCGRTITFRYKPLVEPKEYRCGHCAPQSAAQEKPPQDNRNDAWLAHVISRWLLDVRDRHYEADEQTATVRKHDAKHAPRPAARLTAAQVREAVNSLKVGDYKLAPFEREGTNYADCAEALTEYLNAAPETEKKP